MLHTSHKQTPNGRKRKSVKKTNKKIIVMTSSVLSLTVMSGLKTLHKSRLQSKQKLDKKDASHNRSGQHVISCLLVGWF